MYGPDGWGIQTKKTTLRLMLLKMKRVAASADTKNGPFTFRKNKNYKTFWTLTYTSVVYVPGKHLQPTLSNILKEGWNKD